ncbi:MAG: hypothetical protein KGJ48_17165, partial [Nitrospirota bacterium]|nr:hypothetical protein [Nitrospirota bacterium]
MKPKKLERPDKPHEPDPRHEMFLTLFLFWPLLFDTRYDDFGDENFLVVESQPVDFKSPSLSVI